MVVVSGRFPYDHPFWITLTWGSGTPAVVFTLSHGFHMKMLEKQPKPEGPGWCCGARGEVCAHMSPKDVADPSQTTTTRSYLH